MAPVPSWTREWRPLARQLCAHIIYNNQMNEEDQSLIFKEMLFLRADRVVGQLFSHRFMDTVPRDVLVQTQALATKFRVHLLEDRADRLLHLSSKCDYQVLKLLLELAMNPTAATDQEVAVDLDTKSKWQTVLQEEQHNVQRLELLQEQLVDELFQISSNDEWYQAWEDSDEDERDWDIGSADERATESPRNVGSYCCKAKRIGEAPNDENVKEQEQAGSVLEEQAARQEIERHKWLELSDDELQQHEILSRYFPEISASDKELEEADNDPTVVLDKKIMVPFTMERPWLLCETVMNSAEASSPTGDIISSRVIHEETVVGLVFEALHGTDSFLFDFYPVNPTPPIFSADFRTMAAKRSRNSQNVVLGHISSLTFQHVLDDFAEAASELQMLRDLVCFIHERRNYNEQLRCETLEGLADALSGIIKSLMNSMNDVEQQTYVLTEKDSRPWSGLNSRQITLIGLLGGLKEIFKTVSWLKGILKKCFKGLAHRCWHQIKRAEQAKCVLDSLYCIMEVEYVEGVAAEKNTRSTACLSRSDALLHLFIGTLTPYLGVLNRMVFERGHFETIPLEGELFFGKPASVDVCAAPLREHYQTFRESLMSMAPFQVIQSLVPKFLEPMTSLVHEALTSRQLQNCLLQKQHASVDPLTPPVVETSLQELLLGELERRGYKRICGNSLVLTVTERNTKEDTLSLQQIMLKCVPFNRVFKQCLTMHLENKCHELNTQITSTFRDKLNYMDHVEALRMFVLMEQQDVLNIFSKRLVDHMQKNPVAWADSDKINDFHQSAIQGAFEDNFLSSLQRKIGGRLCLRVDFNLLDSASSDASINIAAMKCLHFTFALPPPLRVLFSASIMQKYSTLGIFLLQAKAVESTLVKFKSTIRHRRSYYLIEKELRQALLTIADMLHYTKTLLNYLTSQLSSEKWSECCKMLQASRSLTEMDATHETYLDHLLNRFFLLDKHATVIQYIVTTFNHILRFVGHVDKFVGEVDRNLRQYFPDLSSQSEKSDQNFADKASNISLLEHSDFRVIRFEMTQSSKEFKRLSHFLVVMLTAMQKHGASPYVDVIVTHLNYNYFYHQKEHPRLPLRVVEASSTKNNR